MQRPALLLFLSVSRWSVSMKPDHRRHTLIFSSRLTFDALLVTFTSSSSTCKNSLELKGCRKVTPLLSFSPSPCLACLACLACRACFSSVSQSAFANRSSCAFVAIGCDTYPTRPTTWARKTRRRPHGVPYIPHYPHPLFLSIRAMCRAPALFFFSFLAQLLISSLLSDILPPPPPPYPTRPNSDRTDYYYRLQTQSADPFDLSAPTTPPEALSRRSVRWGSRTVRALDTYI